MLIENALGFTKLVVRVAKKLDCDDIWWRGQSKSEWELEPSVYRESRLSPYERNVSAGFLWKAPARYPNCPADTDWVGWLMLMQHYRLHTRLLDWTESPLVALFFAVSKHDCVPGALWALDPYKLNENQLNQKAIQYPRCEQLEPLFRVPFAPVNKNDEKTKKVMDKIVAVYAPHRDIRVLVQQSTFTIHGTRTPLNKLATERDFLLKIEIPAEQKRVFRSHLRRLGIRPSFIFPDLEHLAEELNTADPRLMSDAVE